MNDSMNRNFKSYAISCVNIARLELYDAALVTDYVYYEEKPEHFPEDFNFSRGIYYRDTTQKVSYTSISETMMVREDKDGISRIYLKPKILIVMNDNTASSRYYTSYDTAKEKYKKIIKQANLLEM